jgi:hypothetical protein
MSNHVKLDYAHEVLTISAYSHLSLKPYIKLWVTEISVELSTYRRRLSKARQSTSSMVMVVS